MNRRQTSALFWLGMAPVLVGCAGDAPKHWAELEQCLIGDPLVQEENIFARVRGVALAESLAATGSKADWPGRCADFASKLHASLPDDGKPGMVKRALEEQLDCDGGCVFSNPEHPLPAADKLWEAVARADFKREQTPVAPKPKAPLKSLTEADWPKLGSGSVLDHQWSGPGELWLLLKDDSGLASCNVRGARARCAKVEGAPQFNANAPVTFASASRAPVVAGSVFAEGSGLRRLGYSLQSKQQVPLFGDAGHEAYHGVGFVAQPALGADAPDAEAKPVSPQFTVQRLEDGKSVATASLELSARVRGPAVVDDWLVYVERDEEQNTVFKARALGEGARVFGESSTEFPGDFPGPFQVCSARPGAAIGSFVPPIRQLGKPASGKATISVALLEGKVWYAPVTAQFPKQVGLFSRWRCGSGWGGFSWLEQVGKKLVVTELLCKKAGCKTQQASWEQPDLKNALSIGHVHDKIVLLYQSAAGDVRVRVGSLSELTQVGSKLAFESPDFGGVEFGKPTLYEGDQAYLVLEQGGLRLLAIDGTGGVQPVTR